MWSFFLIPAAWHLKVLHLISNFSKIILIMELLFFIWMVPKIKQHFAFLCTYLLHPCLSAKKWCSRPFLCPWWGCFCVIMPPVAKFHLLLVAVIVTAPYESSWLNSEHSNYFAADSKVCHHHTLIHILKSSILITARVSYALKNSWYTWYSILQMCLFQHFNSRCEHSFACSSLLLWTVISWKSWSNIL